MDLTSKFKNKEWREELEERANAPSLCEFGILIRNKKYSTLFYYFAIMIMIKILPNNKKDAFSSRIDKKMNAK